VKSGGWVIASTYWPAPPLRARPLHRFRAVSTLFPHCFHHPRARPPRRRDQRRGALAKPASAENDSSKRGRRHTPMMKYARRLFRPAALHPAIERN